jgi:ribonucleoside-diphosphate reductase alpha chain
LISLALRSGITLADVIQQLRGISCDRAVGFGPNKVLSVPDAIAQALGQHEAEKQGIQQDLLPAPRVSSAPSQSVAQAPAPKAQMSFSGYDPGETFIGTCPECHSGLLYMEGCVKCLSCGYSECG